MLKYVSKHHVVAAQWFRESFGLVWPRCVLNELLSTGVNVTGHTGTDNIYLENIIQIVKGNPNIIYISIKPYITNIK